MTVALQMAGRSPPRAGVTGKSEIPLDKKTRGCSKDVSLRGRLDLLRNVALLKKRIR